MKCGVSMLSNCLFKIKSQSFLICSFIVITLFFLFCFSTKAGVIPPHPQTLITAHRGHHLHAPENTLDAVKEAIAIHADYIEIDVQQTKDGVLVVCHDSNLKRLTSHDVNIWNIRYNDLAKYPLLPACTTTIPTLDEVLKAADKHIKLNIEVKYTEHDKNIIFHLIKLIEHHHMENNCVITSFYKPFLTQVKSINPHLRTGYILDFVPNNITRENVDIISLAFTQVDPILVRQIKGSGKELHVWTVNKESDMLKMLTLGVDNIITDNPILALSKRDHFLHNQ